MPQPRRTASQAPQPDVQAGIATLEQQREAQEHEHAIRVEAEAIRLEGDYEGRLTPGMFARLESLLSRPTPAVYVEHTPVEYKEDGKPKGLPFATTGIKSIQFQIDRMNAVLGLMGWRSLLHYTQGGVLVKAVVVVGNDLHLCSLAKDTGELEWWKEVGGEMKLATIITTREGWGGFQMRTIGDTHKAGETNTLKRVLARMGPGNDVFRVDYEADVLAALGSGDAPPASTFNQSQGARADVATAAPVAAAGGQPQAEPALLEENPSEEEAETRLGALVAEGRVVEFDGEQVVLGAERKAVLDAMDALPEEVRPNAVQKWLIIDPRKDDVRQLREVAVRARNTAKEQGNG